MVGLLLPKLVGEKQRSWGKLYCQRQGEALARHLGLQTLNLLHLRGRDYGRIPSYSLVAVKTVEGRPTMWRWLRRTTMAVASGGAPALRIALATAEGAGASPPNDGWARDALMRWLNDGGRAWQWRLSVTSIDTGNTPFYKMQTYLNSK
jgi:hypothetical protein